jgi:phosphatidylglycerophosphatase A
MYRTVIEWLRRMIGSLFFLGYIPPAPGTLGSLVTVGVLWFFRDKAGPWFLPEHAAAFWLWYCLFCAMCVFFCNNAKELFGANDPKQVIIDEAAGQLITFFLMPLTPRVLVLGFLLFRFFDIVKPFPVYKFEELDDGLGITMDDVAAGILANLSLFVIIGTYHVIKVRL